MYVTEIDNNVPIACTSVIGFLCVHMPHTLAAMVIIIVASTVGAVVTTVIPICICCVICCFVSTCPLYALCHKRNSTAIPAQPVMTTVVAPNSYPMPQSPYPPQAYPYPPPQPYFTASPGIQGDTAYPIAAAPTGHVPQENTVYPAADAPMVTQENTA